MHLAITRRVSPAMERCELSHLERKPIDLALADRQHRAYQACLAELGLEVISLPAEPDLPDSVFVEDPVVVVEEVAVIARSGAVSRRREAESLAEALRPYRPLCFMQEPATLDGGDVLQVGRTIYVGLSHRTNCEGVRQLEEFTKPFGYKVVPVEVRGCLHLKSGVSSLGDGTALVNHTWIDASALHGLRLIDVPEPWGANVLAIRDTVLMPARFSKTAAMLEAIGYRVRTVDVSEMQKAEGAVTCMSVLL